MKGAFGRVKNPVKITNRSDSAVSKRLFLTHAFTLEHRRRLSNRFVVLTGNLSRPMAPSHIEISKEIETIRMIRPPYSFMSSIDIRQYAQTYI